MAKERELKEAVREGRDRVSQEVFLRVIFLFCFLSFSLISHELKHVTISRDGRNSITLAKIGWPLATYFCFGRLRNRFFFQLKHQQSKLLSVSSNFNFCRALFLENTAKGGRIYRHR